MQLRLKIVDFPIGLLPAKVRAEPFDTLDQRTSIVTTVKDDDFAGCRNTSPEAQQIGLTALFFCGRSRAMNPKHARIEAMGDAPDGTALARGIGALEYQQQAAFLEGWMTCKVTQAMLIVLKLAFVDILFQLVV